MVQGERVTRIRGTVFLFCSGLVTLVYEVLWLRQLGHLFGVSAHATATCLAVFFSGMALGQAIAARRCAALASPLRTYGLLEIAAAAAALLALYLPDIYRALYVLPAGDTGFGAHATRIALAAVVLLPPAALLGATLPVMVEAETRHLGNARLRATALYFANTAGGVAGACLAAFWLVPALGYYASYLVAVIAGASIGAAALASAGQAPAAKPVGAALAPPPASLRLSAVAFVSGALALAMEVIWTRMLAQVLHNSVFSFAAVLAVLLLALSLGAGIVHLALRRWPAPPAGILAGLFAAAAVACAASALVFQAQTDGLAYLGGDADWASYMVDVFSLAAAVMLVPGALLGAILPYAVALLAGGDAMPGLRVGRLIASNTAGSVIGSLLAGFALLPALDLWPALLAVAALYAIGAALFTPRPAGVAAAVVALFLLFVPLDPRGLRRVDFDPHGETVLEVVDSAAGTVAVVQRGDVVALRLNNSYTVGTNANIVNDRRKADLPLLLHRRPRSVFFLGMGAGITAAAALDHPLSSITTCELVPEIARLAAKYLPEQSGRLSSDPRSRVVAGDGRHYLARSRERFDVIIADLFVPWHSGAGALYSIEHFANVRQRLGDGGLFAQWLPLYQMSRQELEIIARTMLEVFPRVTLWRGDLLPRSPAIALIGHAGDQPLDLRDVRRNVRRRIGEHGADAAVTDALALLFYAGNLSQARQLFAAAPINSDDRPIIEHGAPITQRRVKAGQGAWLTSLELLRFYAELAAAVPPERDAFLHNLDHRQIEYPKAGRDLYAASVHRDTGDFRQAEIALEAFRQRVPAEVVEIFAQRIPSIK